MLTKAGSSLLDAAKPLQGIRRVANCVWHTLAVPTERTADVALTSLD